MVIFLFTKWFVFGALAMSGTRALPPSLSSAGNSTVPPPKPPPPKPKPTPFPPPDGGQSPVTDVFVKEATVYSAFSREFSRFGHTVAGYGSSLVVGYGSESTSSVLDLFSLELTGRVKQKSTVHSEEKSVMLQPEVNVTWQQRQQVHVSSDNDYYDGFGRTVAVGRTSLVVGAPYTTGSVFSAGAVYAYSVAETADGTVEATGAVQTITAGDSSNINMQFGSTLALENATLAVGAPGADEHGRVSGAVFLYSYHPAIR
jgi:hypothetical protein